MLASSALLMHYLTPAESGFCGHRSGCEAVRTSALGAFGNQYFNIPLIGIVAYLGVFALSFLPTQRVLLKWTAGVGGLVAIGFILQQAVIGTFCWMCLVVDGLAIVAAFAAAAVSDRASPPQSDPLHNWSWWALAVVAVLTPVVWLQVKPTVGVPQVIAQLYKPGHFNVIEFSDYECPHCRRLHPILKQQLARLPEPVHFQRIHVPFPSHALAEGAARADICAGAQGKSSEMADLLFDDPLEDGIWFDHAAKLGLDTEAFNRCLAADSTTEVLADHVDLFKAARLRGLPATFIGRETLMGAPAAEVVEESFQKAQTPEPFRLRGVPYSLIVAVVVVGVVVAGRRRHSASAPSSSNTSR